MTATIHTKSATSPSSAGLTATSAMIASKTLKVFLRDPQAVFPTLLQGVLFLLVFRYVRRRVAACAPSAGRIDDPAVTTQRQRHGGRSTAHPECPSP